MLNHPIVIESFLQIDREIGSHSFNSLEYAIVRRVIHATADFEYKNLFYFSPGSIEHTLIKLAEGIPIITDVGMVKQGVQTMIKKTFNNPLFSALDFAETPEVGMTRSETGIRRCFAEYPHAVYVIGNAPTALLSLCGQVQKTGLLPALIIGAPVGFVSVLESKEVLENTKVQQIRVNGRKGGSPVASAILNALLVLAFEGREEAKNLN